MLASIHPLGERVRHNRWGVTAAAYTSGSATAGAVLGGLLGAAGAAVGGWVPSRAQAAGWLTVSVCMAAAIVELGQPWARVPGMRRQVNEDWLNRYRGWVYGAGFGGQLGLGVATTVTTGAVYAWLALALLAGLAGSGAVSATWAGAAIGGAFGLVRALPMLAMAGVRKPEQLRAVHRSLASAVPLGRRLAGAGLLLTAGSVGVWLVA